MASLADDFDKESDLSAAFDAEPDAAPTRAPETGLPGSRGSFFDFLKSRFAGEEDAPTPDVATLPGVKTMQTPDGPVSMDAQGRRVMSPSEFATQSDAGGARLKEVALEGALSTLSGAGPLMDEMRGAASATNPAAFGRWVQSKFGGPSAPSPVDTYRAKRDETRLDVDRSTANASPNVEVMGRQIPVLPMVGAALPALATPMAATALQRVMAAGVQGAEAAIGQSRADLTRGEIGDFAGDVAKGGGVGLLAGGLGEGLAAGMRGIASGAGARIGDSVATRAAQDAANVADEIASLRGQLGGESQKMSRLFENTQRAAGGGMAPSGQSVIDPALQGRAVMALGDPTTKRLQEKVLERALNEMPGQGGVVERLEQELASRVAGQGAEAARRTSDYFAQPVFQTEVAPRLGRLAFNAATGAGTGAAGGAALGMGSLLTGVGDPLTAAGVGLATGITQGLGKSAITMARNASRSPLAQVGALGALEGAASSSAGATTRAAFGASPVLQSTAGAGGAQAQRNAYDSLMRKFGIAAKSREELADEAYLKSQLGALEP